jgi:hypothetical protein
MENLLYSVLEIVVGVHLLPSEEKDANFDCAMRQTYGVSPGLSDHQNRCKVD